jgi:hypothetical protein
MRHFFWLPTALLAMASAGCENTVQVEGGGGAGGGAGGGPECNAVPSCEPYEVEAPTCDGSVAVNCRSVTACGETIFCEESETCTAVPICDEGDDEVPACPNDGSACYQVELCGAVISCVDNGLAHGCPPSPPASQESCGDLGLVCDYPLNNGCTESWTCIDPTLQGSGGAPGGTPGGSGADEQPIAPYVWELSGTVCVDGGGA